MQTVVYFRDLGTERAKCVSKSFLLVLIELKIDSEWAQLLHREGGLAGGHVVTLGAFSLRAEVDEDLLEDEHGPGAAQHREGLPAEQAEESSCQSMA